MADRPTTRRGVQPKPRPAADDCCRLGPAEASEATAAAALSPAVLLSAVTWSLLRFAVQPLFGRAEYYIDEEFHVPQARRYCRAEFREWDPKITTLPGIYLLSAAILVPFMQIYNTILSLIGSTDDTVSDPCSLTALRAVNAVGAPACLYYAYLRCQLFLTQNENKKPSNTKWSYIILSMSVATFPIIYAPYSMLYYTDIWATASVFLWYSYHLNKKTKSWLKTLFGGFCVLCRQTNIAWLVFACIIDACRCAEQCFPSVKNSVSTISYVQATIIELYNCCSIKNKNKSKKLIDFIQKCWQATSSNLIVIISFMLFVILLNNGDIVVGDRSAHIPCFHPMQLCYFVLFLIAFSLPYFLSQVFFNRKNFKVSKHLKITMIFRKTHKTFPRKILLVLLIATTGLVYMNTIAHPYLLADNRHYTFYAWRLFFGPGKPVFLRYLPVPIYAYGLYFVDMTLTKTSIAYKLAYWVVTPIVICAQFLLEPRYFVVPYLMYRLHSYKNNLYLYNLKAAIVEFVSFQLCNFVILWIFLYRPFISTMDDTGRLDRFTW